MKTSRAADDSVNAELGGHSNVSLGIHSVSRHGRRLVYAAVASGLLVVCSFAMILPVFGVHLQEHLQIDAGRFGMLFSVGPLVGTLVLIPAGLAIRRWGPRPTPRAVLSLSR